MQFTAEDFLREYRQFRVLMGSRTFWSLPVETREKAIAGFTLVYLNTVPRSDGYDENWLSDNYYNAMQEYMQREAISVRMGLTTV